MTFLLLTNAGAGSADRERVDVVVQILEIELDGEPVAAPDRPVLEVSIGNGATVGGGLALNPGADPADGRLDVVVSYAAGPLRRFSYGLDLLRQRHPERSDVLRRSCDTVSVAGAPFYLSADGEISGPIPRRTWHVERAALRMVLLEEDSCDVRIAEHD